VTKSRSVWFVGIVLMVSTLVAPMVMSDESIEDTGSPLLLISEEYNVWVLESYAVTEVIRVFQNPTEDPVDHVFDFLIPQGALISNFSLEVQGNVYYALVLEKGEAEEKYQQAVENGTSAGLVASYGDNHFGYMVSFAPKEKMTANIRYEQVMLKTNGWHSLELLLNSTRNLTMPETLSVQISVSAPEDIDVLQTLGYEDHTWVTFPSDNEAMVTVSVEGITQREDMEVRWSTGAGSEVGKMYFYELDGVGYFVHVFDPDPGLYGPSPIPKDFVFVMDKSGSMSGLKFAQSQVAMNFSYAHLSPSDRFSFVEFNTGFNTYSDDLLPATTENKAAIISHIMSLGAGGGTDIHSAVIEALDIFKAAGEPMPVIVLLSDGRANSGLYHRSEFRQDVLNQNTVDASIFCIALGNGADWPFLEALAIENDGRAIWVHENEDVITVIDDFVSSFSNALLADLSFEYGPDVYDVYPSRVRAHYEGSEVLVTGRISPDAGDLSCKVTARSPGGDVVSEELFPVEMLPGNDFVPRFWAFQRIKDLENSMKVNGPDNDTIAQIIDLATEFHFATDHTSLFVELPDALKEQFYGDDEPMQPYVGLAMGTDVSGGSYSHSVASSSTLSYTRTLGTSGSTGSFKSGGVATDGDHDNGAIPEPEVKAYIEWLPGVDYGTPTGDPIQRPDIPWQSDNPQSSVPTDEDVHRGYETGLWVYMVLAVLCLIAVVHPWVLRLAGKRGSS
jgi:hypothetical protein